MKVAAFIEPPQGAVIEKILRHCGLWQPSTPRPPPPVCWGWSDADWFADDEFFDGGFTNGLADDFVQVAPDDSAYVDIDPFEAGEYEAAY